MDDELIDRREAPRLPAELLGMPQATRRPGGPVEVVDLSPQGIQVQSVRPLRPDTRVLARVVVGDQTVMIPGGGTAMFCVGGRPRSGDLSDRAAVRRVVRPYPGRAGHANVAASCAAMAWRDEGDPATGRAESH